MYKFKNLNQLARHSAGMVIFDSNSISIFYDNASISIIGGNDVKKVIVHEFEDDSIRIYNMNDEQYKSTVNKFREFRSHNYSSEHDIAYSLTKRIYNTDNLMTDDYEVHLNFNFDEYTNYDVNPATHGIVGGTGVYFHHLIEDTVESQAAFVRRLQEEQFLGLSNEEVRNDILNERVPTAPRLRRGGLRTQGRSNTEQFYEADDDEVHRRWMNLNWINEL